MAEGRLDRIGYAYSFWGNLTEESKELVRNAANNGPLPTQQKLLNNRVSAGIVLSGVASLLTLAKESGLHVKDNRPYR